MLPRTLSEQWEAFRPRLHHLRSWLGTPERSHSLLLLLWPLVALVIAVLVIRLVSTAKELADLISAFASLTWPLVALAIVSWFRPEIRAILSRIRKGKFLGQEIELDELQARTEAAEVTLSTIISATGSAVGTSSATAEGARVEGAGAEAVQDAIEEVLREASRSPRLGLMLLSAKIERAARELAADVGLNVSRRPVPLGTMIRMLVQAEQISFEDAEALNLFNQIRNWIVHGHDADDDEIARAIELRNPIAQVAPIEAASTARDNGADRWPLRLESRGLPWANLGHGSRKSGNPHEPPRTSKTLKLKSLLPNPLECLLSDLASQASDEGSIPFTRSRLTR